MMRRIEAMAEARAVALVAALAASAKADLPPGVRAEPGDGGIALSGPGLARAVAFDGRMRVPGRAR
ncbi:hypothetical protein SAMN06295912_10272 [Sphingomonas laterariae]|uniref:Uncharacterized protein n=1 Tax=Edaphosphingomonas laterariae TaxID=861865 RepID=A0A239C9R2_9SPHN|nr:hypothetical protein [Sphingomonas laterariae]SNS16632.1 hypothetical protein SAMN06295912_10272 [Sphingomonas laterariae]